MTAPTHNISAQMRLRALRSAMYAGRNVMNAIKGGLLAFTLRGNLRRLIAPGSGIC